MSFSCPNPQQIPWGNAHLHSLFQLSLLLPFHMTCHLGRCSYINHCALQWVHTFRAWLAPGGISCVCFSLYLSSYTGAGFTLATCLGLVSLKTASVALRATWAADEGALDVHRSLQTHPLHWAQPQQMAQHCGSEWGRASMWLGGVLLCMCILGKACFLEPIRANGCVVAGYFCSFTVVSAFVWDVLLKKYAVRSLALIKVGVFHLCFAV